MAGINNAFHVEVLLKRDIDYILRAGKIMLINEFVKCIDAKRNRPYGLREAIEAKEGLKAPASTWTYLVDDGMEQLGLNPVCLAPVVPQVKVKICPGLCKLPKMLEKLE